MKIQLGSKSEKDSNVPKRDLDKTPVTAATVRMSQALAKTTMSIGQTISGKVAARPPALFGGSFGKPPGVSTPTTLTTPASQAGKGVPSGPGKLQPASALATWASEMLVKSAVVDVAATKSAISPGKSSLLPTPVPSRVAVTQPSVVQDASGRKALLPTPSSAGQIQGDLAGSKHPAGGDGKNKTDGGVTPAKDLPLTKTTAVASAVKKIPVQGILIRYVRQLTCIVFLR